MLSINYTELRKDLKKNLDQATENNELIVVHRPNGKSVIIVSLDEYNSLNETSYLLSSAKNKERLKSSIEQIKNKNFKKLDL